MTLTGANNQLSKKPPSPAPSIIPQYCTFLKNTGPEYIAQCLNNLVYAWTIRKNSFWMYLVDFNGNVAFCYAWDGADWKYIQFNIDLIDSFY